MFGSYEGAMVDAAAAPQIGCRTLCQHPGCGLPIELVASAYPSNPPYWTHLEGWGGRWHEPTPVEPERPEPAAAQRMLADFQRTYDGYRAGREDGLSEGRQAGLTDLAAQLREWAGNGVHEWHAALRHAARWAEQLADGGQLVAPQRCAAAHPQDRTPCEGPLDAVQVVDQGEASVSGCVRHSAVLLATLTGGRVYPGSVQGAAIQTYERAQGLAPYGFGAAGDPA